MCDNAVEFLGRTYRQPLLAVSAVAPGLYARVPTLARAHELRLKAVRALAIAQEHGPVAAAKVCKEAPPSQPFSCFQQEGIGHDAPYALIQHSEAV